MPGAFVFGGYNYLEELEQEAAQGKDGRMASLKFDTAINTGMIAGTIGPFLEIAGYQNFKNRIDNFRARAGRNHFALSVFAERHALEIALWDIIARYREYGRLPPPDSDPIVRSDQLRAYTFMWLLNKVCMKLSSSARSRMTGRFKTAFTDENDLLNIEHELTTIGHLAHYGCEIYCHDLEDGGGFDFLAKRDGIEFEVECKMISADKGRQIHEHDLLALGEHIQRAIDWPNFNNRGKGILIRVHVQARLSRDISILKTMAAGVANLALGVAASESEEWRYESFPFEIVDSPFQAWGDSLEPDLDEVHGFLERLTGVQDDKSLVYGAEGVAALVVSVCSEKGANVPDSVYRELKHAATQLSSKRPGVVYAAFQDLTEEELLVLADEPTTGFDYIASKLFDSDVRNHVYGVTFFSNFWYSIYPDGSLGSQGKVFRFINFNNPHADDRRLRLDSPNVQKLEVKPFLQR